MPKTILSILFLAFVSFANAQTLEELTQTASGFMRQGDYANAVLVYNRALQKYPNNVMVSKNLAMAYNYQKENEKALEVIKPLLDNEAADDQCFQIAGNIYKELGQAKECEKMYKKGIKRFPQSGPLYNEYGELLIAQKDDNAIKQWEAGIKADPSYSKNYYNASKFYYLTDDRTWTMLYGEIFVNMEPQSPRTPEIKSLLLDSYKKLFIQMSEGNKAKDKSAFGAAVLQEFKSLSALAGLGVNTNALTMIRTRFILNWFPEKDKKYPFRLFEMQQHLLQEGMFEAYNQWLFGTVENLSAYQNWITAHKAENQSFLDLQKSRMFKVPANQYYQD